MNISHVPHNHLAVVIQEGRHVQVKGHYPNTKQGKREAHRRWEQVYMDVMEALSLERLAVPSMIRDVEVEIVLAT